MARVGGIGPNPSWWNEPKKLTNISTFYTTRARDKDRTDFSSTFQGISENETEQGRRFWKGLITNMDALTEELGISKEEYLNLSCIAMALASQETGFGQEKRYVGENVGLHKVLRNTAKHIQQLLTPAGSASSGLTQIKIYDFMKDENKLSPKLREILVNHGIEAKSTTKNNLFASPEKSAIATIVILKSLEDNYDKYDELFKKKHAEIEGRIDPKQKDTRGQDLISKIQDVYVTTKGKKKDDIRIAFKQWLLAVDGSKLSDSGHIDKDYNEEYQLNKLNSLLKLETPIVQEDLDYIRYSLTADKEKMNMTQYCAYAWNHGTGKSGMALDRLLATKIGIIFAKPDSFDPDQYTVNVERLALKYAEQMTGKK